MKPTNVTEIQKAADRVRSARSAAMIRQDTASEAELIAAVEAFSKLNEAQA